jgi:methyltransferase (TIGR00027 family)
MSIASNHAASRTARMVAALRGRASARPQPLCDDPWALALAGEEGEALADAFSPNFPAFELWMAVRTAYLDQYVRHFTASPQDFTQVVILGAGLDTRAARLARPGVTFFEVDHPATQADKRARVDTLPGYPREAARYVACDFETQDFMTTLQTAGFDPGRAALVLWEGVVPYLSEPAIRASLRRIAQACEPRSVLLFDYVGKRIATRQGLRADDERNVALLDGLGEPVVFGTNDVLPMLHDEGFRHVRTVSFDEACLSLTGSYDRARMFRFQHVAIASRVPCALL